MLKAALVGCGNIAKVHLPYVSKNERVDRAAICDRDELRRILTPHRAYAAYALGQLRPELFKRSEWWLARGANGQALLLHSRGSRAGGIRAAGFAR